MQTARKSGVTVRISFRFFDFFLWSFASDRSVKSGASLIWTSPLRFRYGIERKVEFAYKDYSIRGSIVLAPYYFESIVVYVP
jgi:hypothetical protein